MRNLFLIQLLGTTLLAQPNFIASLYPTQHALNVPADAELRVGLQAPLDPTSFSDSSIYVWSDITGLHKLTVTLENGNKNLRIVPRHWRVANRPAFNASERVTVTLTTRLRYADDRPFEGFAWHYTVAVRQNRGGDFRPLVIFGGGGSYYFNIADFNGDGWCDLIGNDDGIEGKMIVFLNDGKGALQFNHKEDIINPNAETADLDRDGDQDIVYAGDYLIFNDGQANFSVKRFPERPSGFAKAHDFNNDGVMDFAIGGVLSDTLYFGLSVNRNPFKKLLKVITPIRRPTFYDHGISYDLNYDGRVDFLYIGGSISEKINPGFASLQVTAFDSLKILQTLVLPYEQRNFYGNDLNGDGDIDYVFIPGDSIGYFFINNGNGLLKPAGGPRDKFYQTIEGGDLDGDGDIDLACVRSNLVSTFPERYAPDVSILLNDGKGNFSLASRFRLPFDRPLSDMVRAVDLDGDGDLDLIGVANGLFYIVSNGAYPNAVAQHPSASLPLKFSLTAIYPNPAKNKAEIEVKLPKHNDDKVFVSIFDINGRLIRNWRFDGHQNVIRLTWDTRDQNAQPLPNGIYFVQARIGQLSVSEKLLLLN